MEEPKCKNVTWVMKSNKRHMLHSPYALPSSSSSSLSSSHPWRHHKKPRASHGHDDGRSGWSSWCMAWPSSRSYPCSFCKRDFRSPQALGGHMNVHRRHRALLKQQQHHHHHHGNESAVIKSTATDHVGSGGSDDLTVEDADAKKLLQEKKEFDNGSTEGLDLELRLGDPSLLG